MFKRLFKVKVLLPILLGLVIGGILFALGDADDAPGLSFIGMAIGFLLLMRGIYNGEIIRKGYHIPFILLMFGIVAMIFPIVLFLDGELDGLLTVMFGAITIGIALIAFALFKLKKVRDETK